MPKISDYLASADQRPAGFDYMRLLLSLFVMIVHAAHISLGRDFNEGLWHQPFTRAILSAAMPMFFTLSGFLVAASMQRSRTIVKFMGLRFIRIYPALAVDILFTALILGPLVTTLPMEQYFTDPSFFSYLNNIWGHDIVFLLPGVFQSANVSFVNMQLWTIPFELTCYMILGVLMVCSFRGRFRAVLLLGSLAYLAIALALTGFASGWTFADWDGAVGGRMLVVSFLLGVNIYMWREEIPASPALAVGALILSGLAFTYGPFNRILGVFPAAIFTIYLGIANPRRIALLKSADLSYGIFLYHFAIMQAVVYFAGGSLPFLWTFLISLPIVIGFAALSWNFVEKPALALRAKVDQLERWWMTTWPHKLAIRAEGIAIARTSPQPA